MDRARKCPRCGCITPHERCSVRLSAHDEACGSHTKLIPDIHLGKKLSIDLSLTLRFDHATLRPYILVQKPSGQEQVTLQAQDLIHA